MNSERAKERLAALRKRQRELRKKIDDLREALRKAGVDPDAPAVDLTERNKAMYGRYLDGLTYEQIGKEYKLSTQRARDICHRMEVMNRQKAKRERE